MQSILKCIASTHCVVYTIKQDSRIYDISALNDINAGLDELMVAFSSDLYRKKWHSFSVLPNSTKHFYNQKNQ